MDASPHLHKRLRSQYEKHKCPLSEFPFLPLDVIDKDITEKSVEETIQNSVKDDGRNGLLSLLSAWAWSPQRPYLSQVVSHAKKVFAILAIIGEPLAIEKLLAEGITDEDLPLRRRNGNIDDNNLESLNGGKTFPSFASWKDDRRVADFVEKQWIVLAPILDSSGKNITLDPKSALPFLKVKPAGGGPLSVVYRCTVHPAHQNGLPVNEGKFQVAAKEFRNERSFRQEKDNLARIQGIRHSHLIQHFATWEKGNLYYVIFPWAHGGNLADYWQRMDSVERTSELTLWFLRQMRGIAGAIEALHEVNCRHGDLKPENILHFIETEDGRGTLVIADVGVSRVHKQPTMLRQDNTTTRATTPAYEAPETLGDDKGPRARRYDMWSLGCILLELLIWLLEDSKAIERFRTARDGPHFEFYLQKKGKQPELHPIVLGAIDCIRRDVRCQGGTAFEAVVNLIAEHLLLIDAESRDTADEVFQKLGAIVKQAEQDPGYLFKTVGFVPDQLCFEPRLARKDSVAFESSADTIFEETGEV